MDKFQIDMSKEKLVLFLSTEILICKSYNNINSIEAVSNCMSKDFCEFYRFKENQQEYKKMYDFAKHSIEYMNRLTAITSMYSTFEQYLKVFLELPSKNTSLEEKVKVVCNRYNYNIEKNSYYEKINKYRIINNAIKHGNISNDFKIKYPNLINQKCNIKKYGTILDSSLNITEDEVTECCICLCNFTKELYEYLMKIIKH